MDQWDPTLTLFTLDDAAKDMERESIDIGVSSMLEAMGNVMGVLHDTIMLASQVLRDLASRLFPLGFLCF